MSFQFRLVDTNPFNICSLPPLTFLVNRIQLTLANLYKRTVSSPQLIVHLAKGQNRSAACPFPSVISREISQGRRKPAAVVPDSCGLCYGYAGQRTRFGVSPGTRKDICIITAAVAAGMTGVNSFETTVSNEGGFTELRSDKAGAAICAPLCGTQHCFTGIKTVIHAPGFYEPAAQVLSNARWRAFGAALGIG